MSATRIADRTAAETLARLFDLSGYVEGLPPAPADDLDPDSLADRLDRIAESSLCPWCDEPSEAVGFHKPGTGDVRTFLRCAACNTLGEF